MTNQAKIKEAKRLLNIVAVRLAMEPIQWACCLDAIERDPTGLCGATELCSTLMGG